MSPDPNEKVPPVSEQSDFEKFCASCGEKVDAVKEACETCGEKMGPVKEVCSRCGKKMGSMMKHCMDCCEKSGMMKTCIEKGGWALLIPYSIGVILFLVGWFLSAEALRLIWLILSSLIATVGFIGLVMVNLMIRKSPKEGDNSDEVNDPKE
ncbi:hypothetical protein Ga0123461_1637 [Mariprofundus aestuarium]|uniref:Double zinc ribbon n=1 Tax=Mariprofundus aestuarium TaxID=1921086 RepID=A0A2K8KYG5_MARES|nr:hypothetical protein [Mariprofundus aestuarium]ATX80050.1 hypothetical protein Ga0123461_1637 [Mariprofundus aestuarium]